MPTAPPMSAQRVHTRRAIGFVAMSALLPGSVQLFAGNRTVGRIAGRVFGTALALVVLVGLGLLFFRNATLGFLITPWVATTIRTVLWILFAAWIGLLVDAWRLAQPLRLQRRSRLVLAGVTLLVALAAGFGTSLVASGTVAAGNVGEVFSGGGDSGQKAGRYNILLLGADASEKREGLRPDSINVASVDAETGRTVLFGLPRNLQKVRFPESSPLRDLYPDGYQCPEGACMLNGIWTLGEDHTDLYPGQEAGLAATKEAIGETLGLELNYYALVDMAGFQQLIDAMGGIRLDIGKRIPIGGVSTKISGYIEPGRDVHLDGRHALWFARSRAESSDYERMARQKCVMSAMAKQLDPMLVATKFVELSEAGKNILHTDVGTGEVANLAELALKARSLKISSVNFTPPMIVSADPDFDLIRQRVKEAIDQAEQLDANSPAPSPSPSSAAPSTAAPSTAAPTSKAPTPTASAEESATQASDPSPTAVGTGQVDEPFTETTDLETVCTVS